MRGRGVHLVARCLGAAALAAAMLAAQDPAPPQTPPPAPPDTPAQDAPTPDRPPTDVESPANVDALPPLEEVRARLAELEATVEQEGPPSPVLAAELEHLQKAVAAMERAAEVEAAAAALAEEARLAPQQLAQIDAFLARPIEQMITPVRADATAEDLAADLRAGRTRLESERTLRAQIDVEVQGAESRRRALAAERAAATERVEQIDVELAGMAADDSQANRAVTAKRWSLLAQKRQAEAELARLDAERRVMDAKAPLYEKRRQYRDRRIEIESRAAAAIESTLGKRQAEAAERDRQAAADERRAAADAHPIVRTIAEENESLATRAAELATSFQRETAERQLLEEMIVEWRGAFERTRERLANVSLSTGIGTYLRSQRQRMPDVETHRRRLRVLDTSISDLNNESALWDDALDRLGDLDAALDERLAASSDPLPAEPEAFAELRAVALEALGRQKQYLQTLAGAAAGSNDLLVDLRAREHELIGVLAAYREYIDERVLWIRSARTVGPSDVADTWRAITRFVDRDRWSAALGAAADDVVAWPPLYAGLTLAIAAVFVLQPRWRRLLSEVARRTEKSATLRFTLTIWAMLLTLGLAAAWPALLLAIGWRLHEAAGHLAFGAALSAGFLRAGAVMFALQAAFSLCRVDGLGESHFGWLSSNTALARRHVRWFVPIAVPAAFFIASTEGEAVARDSLGRACFIASMLALAVFVQRVCSPTRGIFRGLLTRFRAGWLDRLKYLWFAAMVFSPVALAIAAAFGYFYTALQLERRLLDTAWVILLIVVAHATLLRALYLAQRRLAIEQAKRKAAERARALAAEQASPSPDGSTPAPDPAGGSVPESVDIDVAAVSAQTRQLLNTGLAITIVISVLLVWVDVLPALGLLREVELWAIEGASGAAGSTDAGAIPGVTPSAADGSTAVAAPAGGVITLADLVKALVIVGVTMLVSRNIPGLLEITLLQRLPISPSGRYAFTTIARYAMVIVGMVLAFNAIGIGWSKVQFLAAAITVGLGFGLQEIFANFVSGLIILFERPIRVGDTVTVGNVSGVVTRIRMRATTILDPDRKELIIPNKEFVTGQVMNWTLTDPILRVRVPIGIAYGSDVPRVKSILVDVARRHENVLVDPPPQAIFNGFGASTLDFELRAFVSSIDHMVAVRDDLHTRIDAAFRAAGIEIAFNQQDIRIRSVDTPIVLRHEAPDIQPPGEG
jgi:potassium efflux system protein